MATPQKIIHGQWPRSWAAVAAVTLAGVGLGQGWELAKSAHDHGGAAWLLVFLVAALVLSMPLRMAELMLGRRSRRSPVEGMAHLTREIDLPRGWRVLGWAMLAAALLVLSLLGVLSGWAFTYLGHLLVAESGPVVYTSLNAGGNLFVATALVVGAAGALALHGLQKLAPVLLVGLGLVIFLLAGAAATGSGGFGALLGHADFARALSLDGLTAAFLHALLLAAGGLGVWFVAGTYLDKEVSIGGVALQAISLQMVLLVLMAAALAPGAALLMNYQSISKLMMVSLPVALAHQGGMLLPWTIFGAIAVSGLLAMVVISEPLLLFLREKGLKPLVALLVLYSACGAIALSAGMMLDLMVPVRAMLLAALLVLAVFAGWKMKISHARKELGLPSEAVYNLWRVSIRIMVPLALLLVIARTLRLF